jgi:hypothetical protein
LFQARAALEAEILVLRHQLNVLQRRSPKRVIFGCIDRLLLVGLYRLAPGTLDALKIIKPTTVLRWHRAGFRAYWRWKSRPLGGRPPVPADVRRLIREMSIANPLWGAPRIHGELLKLGIDVGQTTVAKYMARRRRPPSQGWRTFLRNHADGIASMDLFVVPTFSFRVLYGLLILQHGRRELLWMGVTAHPTAEWIARQLTEAYGWQRAPRYIIRDRDRVYGHAVLSRLRAMGIRDQPIAPRSPWRTDVRSGLSDRSGGTGLTMSSCLASGIFVICSRRIKNTTTRPARICIGDGGRPRRAGPVSGQQLRCGINFASLSSIRSGGTLMPKKFHLGWFTNFTVDEWNDPFASGGGKPWNGKYYVEMARSLERAWIVPAWPPRHHKRRVGGTFLVSSRGVGLPELQRPRVGQPAMARFLIVNIRKICRPAGSGRHRRTDDRGNAMGRNIDLSRPEFGGAVLQQYQAMPTSRNMQR